MEGNYIGKTLLVVDDEVAFSEFVSEIAVQAGYQVTAIADSSLFEQIYSEKTFHVIVLDLSMPGKDGVELLRFLAEQGATAKLILMSGYDDSVLSTAHDLATAHGLDVIHHLSKPFRATELHTVLSTQPNWQQPSFSKRESPAHNITVSDIKQGIERGEFCYFYQPQVNLGTGYTEGFEALARWQHPDLGLIAPDSFIPVAENNGLINSLTWALIDSGMRDMASIDLHFPQATLSINLSANQLIDLTIPDRLYKKVSHYGQSPERFVIEITETGVIADLRRALDILARFRIKGFQISIDDFGTGSAMYEHLQRLPLTELKIDRSFISKCLEDKKSQAIVEQTIGLAHKLNLKTVAEGIETKEVVEKLLQLDCEIGQGYFYSKPLPLADLEQWHQQNPLTI